MLLYVRNSVFFSWVRWGLNYFTELPLYQCLYLHQIERPLSFIFPYHYGLTQLLCMPLLTSENLPLDIKRMTVKLNEFEGFGLLDYICIDSFTLISKTSRRLNNSFLTIFFIFMIVIALMNVRRLCSH